MSRKLAALLAAPMLLAVACGGSDEEGGGSSGGDSTELDQVTVGVIPILDVAPIYLGDEQGFFEEQGIDLTLEAAQGGAAVVPGVMSGQFQFGFSNITSLLLAAQEGLPLQIVANGVASTGDPETDFSGVMVQADSPIQSAADLQGQTISVNNLKNIGEVTIRKAIEDAGGDPTDVEFVELPFPDMPAALEAGDVDAAWVVEPFVTVIKGQGGRSVLANFAEPIPDLTVATYFTTEQVLQEDPELVDNFQAAMQESLAYANDNPDEVRRIILTYTQVPEAAAAEIALPSFPEEINWDSVTTVAELMQEFGITEEQADVDALDATD